jgi:phospholipid-translocating ATPase
MAREGVEDLARHKYDDKLNSEPTMLFEDGNFHKTESGKLKIGEIVLVKQDEDFPADLLLLDSSILNGVCMIETATLDGEKAPKNKIACKATAGIFRNEDNSYRTDVTITGVCVGDKPCPDLYKYDGKLSILYKTQKESEMRIESGLDAKQLLLKGKN